MIVPIVLALVPFFAQPQTVAATCSGPDLAITSAAVKSMVPQGGLNNISVGITVTNHGSERQASNVLQSVQVYQNGNKVDRKGVPPLRPGQSYTAVYRFQRSTEASPHTTSLRFQLVQSSGSSPSCGGSGATRSLMV